MKKYINAALMLSSIGLLFYTLYNQKQTVSKLKSTNKLLMMKCDSLESEQSALKINEGRFQYIIDRAEAEMSPDCKEEFEKIIHETE